MKFKFDRVIVPLVLAGSIAVIDRITKLWALKHALIKQSVCGPIFCELAFNRGISWGMFHSEHPTMQFVLIGLIGVILTLFARYTYDSYMRGKSLVPHAMIIVGALCNAWDRIAYGGVVDFIVLSAYDWQFPTFNVADVSIVLGVLILFISESDFFSHE